MQFAAVNVMNRVPHGAQRYRDEILRPIVVPFIHRHRIMCTQILEAENVLPWPANSPDMSPIEHALDQRVRQRVPGPDNIQQLRTSIAEE